MKQQRNFTQDYFTILLVNSKINVGEFTQLFLKKIPIYCKPTKIYYTLYNVTVSYILKYSKARKKYVTNIGSVFIIKTYYPSK